MFTERVIVLFVVLSGLAAYFRWKEAHWRRAGEYGLLIGGGLVGALFGVAHNHVSSMISPEYFVVWKGLIAGDNLGFQAMVLGGQAGFVAGCITAGVLLIPLTRRCSRYGQLMRAMFISMVWVISSAAIGSGVGGVFVPTLPWAFTVADDLYVVQEIPRFLTAWGMHIGSYGGGMLCVTVCFFRSYYHVKSSLSAD